MRLFGRLSLIVLACAAFLSPPNPAPPSVSISHDKLNECGRGFVFCNDHQAYSLSEIESGALQIPIFPLLPSEVVIVNDTGKTVTDLQFTLMTFEFLSFDMRVPDCAERQIASQGLRGRENCGPDSRANPFTPVAAQFTYSADNKKGHCGRRVLRHNHRRLPSRRLSLRRRLRDSAAPAAAERAEASARTRTAVAVTLGTTKRNEEAAASSFCIPISRCLYFSVVSVGCRCTVMPSCPAWNAIICFSVSYGIDAIARKWPFTASTAPARCPDPRKLRRGIDRCLRLRKRRTSRDRRRITRPPP